MLIELPNNKTVGLRGVSNEMLKYCPSSMLASLIAEMFDCIVNEQIQPTAFNVSILKPIIKDEKQPNDQISNTRPVAISDSIQNLFERFILGKLNASHSENNQQFEFKPNSSCAHAVFTVMSKRLAMAAVMISKASNRLVAQDFAYTNPCWLELIKLFWQR